jgi:hypothetical protein
MPQNGTEPWERQKGESTKAFEAFSIYRDMGPERSLRKVADQLGKSRALIERWSRLWKWVERTREYDNDLEKKAHAKAVKAVQDMTDRHIKIAMQLQAKALNALQQLPVQDMTAKEILSFLTEATKLERSGRVEEAGGKEQADGTETAAPVIITGEGDLK